MTLSSLNELRLAVVMAVGGPVSGAEARRVEAWVSAVGRPVRLAGTADAISFFRHRTGVESALLGPDINMSLAGKDDRYATALGWRTVPWRPAGTKSGPNLQWWRILETVASEEGVEWLLLVEADTIPAEECVADRVRDLLSMHPDAWVIGALPHAASLGRLDPRLRDHLNGAALYHVGDGSFQQFLRSVWLPSLLLVLQDQVDIAFDCLTAPSLWQDIPMELGDAWARNAARFQSTDTMVNASSLSGRPAQRALDAALRDPKVWFVHSKVIP